MVPVEPRDRDRRVQTSLCQISFISNNLNAFLDRVVHEHDVQLRRHDVYDKLHLHLQDIDRSVLINCSIPGKSKGRMACLSTCLAKYDNNDIECVHSPAGFYFHHSSTFEIEKSLIYPQQLDPGRRTPVKAVPVSVSTSVSRQDMHIQNIGHRPSYSLSIVSMQRKSRERDWGGERKKEREKGRREAEGKRWIPLPAASSYRGLSQEAPTTTLRAKFLLLDKLGVWQINSSENESIFQATERCQDAFSMCSKCVLAVRARIVDRRAKTLRDNPTLAGTNSPRKDRKRSKIGDPPELKVEAIKTHTEPDFIDPLPSGSEREVQPLIHPPSTIDD